MRLLLALLIVAPFASAAQDKPVRPNFVIMMCDDQRWDAMSLAGNTILKTPNMDRIGREGIVFKNAFRPAMDSAKTLRNSSVRW